MYNNAPEAGLASLLASRGRGGDSALVHMAPEELAGLQKLAMAHGGSLTINPETGLYEANFLKKVLPMIIGAVLPGVPGLGALAKTVGFGSQALGSALLVGGATALIEGDLKKGLMAGLGAYSGANLRGAFEASAAAPVSPVTSEGVVQAGQAAGRAAETIGATATAPTQVTEAISRASPDAASRFISSANQVARTAAAPSVAPTGLRGLLQGAQNLVTNPQSRTAFGQALGGNLSKYATFAGAMDAFTPEVKMPSAGEMDENIVYMPGELDPMYGLGAQYSRFKPGRYFKRTPQGLVPYNPNKMAPGTFYGAMGGVVPNPNPNYPMSREVITNYQPNINPFTGEERFAEGGEVRRSSMIYNPEPPNPLERMLQPGESFTDIPRPIQIAAPSPFDEPTRSTETAETLFNQFRRYNPDLSEGLLRGAAQNRANYLQSQYEQNMAVYNSPESVAARKAAQERPLVDPLSFPKNSADYWYHTFINEASKTGQPIKDLNAARREAEQRADIFARQGAGTSPVTTSTPSTSVPYTPAVTSTGSTTVNPYSSVTAPASPFDPASVTPYIAGPTSSNAKPFVPSSVTPSSLGTSEAQNKFSTEDIKKAAEIRDEKLGLTPATSVFTPTNPYAEISSSLTGGDPSTVIPTTTPTALSPEAAAARKRYEGMAYGAPPPPVDTKPVMDYVADLNRRATSQVAYPYPGGFTYGRGGDGTVPGGGGGSSDGGGGGGGGKTPTEDLQTTLLINQIGMPAFQALIQAGRTGGTAGITAALQRMPNEYGQAFKNWALTDPSKGFSAGNLRAGMDFSSLGSVTGAATAALGVYNTGKAIEAGKEGRAAANAFMTAMQFGGPVTAVAAAALAAIGASMVNTKEFGDVALRNYWNAVDQGRGIGQTDPNELAQGFINFYRTNKNQFAGQEKYGRTGNEDFMYDMTQVINDAVNKGVVRKDIDAATMYKLVVEPWLSKMGSGPQNEDARAIQDVMMTDLINNFMQGKPISNAQVKGDKNYKIVSEKPVYAGAASTTQQTNSTATNPYSTPASGGRRDSANPEYWYNVFKTENPGLEEDMLRRVARDRATQFGFMPDSTNPFAEGGAVGEDYNFGFAGGGMPEYQAGGTLLNGPGDGMSDDIPAVIRGKGVQRAALADGEFVVPADVVSHLGNGSTNAGAKRLYAMMDKIRQSRTGKTQQAPAVNPNRFLPV